MTLFGFSLQAKNLPRILAARIEAAREMGSNRPEPLAQSAILRGNPR